MQISQLAATLLILGAVHVVFTLPQYRQVPQQRHWYMVNRQNPAVDPRIASIYDDPALRGGLADTLPPQQRSALTDFLARYFPRLFRPAIVAADPAPALPPGATVYQSRPSSLLPYDSYPLPSTDYDVADHGGYSGGFVYERPNDGDRGSYLPYPGRGHAYPPGLSYPLDPYQTGYKKLRD